MSQPRNLLRRPIPARRPRASTTTDGAPPTTAGPRLAARLPALASPVYRRFIVGAFIGTIGSWMQTTAQGWLVLDLTNSSALLGLTSAIQSSPTLILSLLAGVLADRVDLRRLLVASQGAGAVLAGILAVLTSAGVVQFWHVVVIAGLAGSAQAFGMPAFQAVVSTIVERPAIGNAIALNSAQFNLGRILGPAVAGIAIAAGGLAVAFWANAASFVVVAVVVALLPIPSPAALVRVEASLWANLVDGIDYLRREPVIRALVLLAAVPALFVLNYLVLMPVYARDVLGIGAAGLGILTAGVGVGALSGALSVAVLRPSGGSGGVLLLGLTLSSTALIVFAVSRWLPLSLVALAVLGGAQVAYYATTNTLIQILVPARLRGRVMSLYILTSLGVVPIGNLLAGLVAQEFGPTVALAGGGLLTLLAVGAVAFAFPALRGLRAETFVSQAA
jgi:MFS family permease